MTVSSETSKSGPYTGNGVTVAFPYGFRILDEAHIRVVRTEAGVETDVTTGFTVSGVGVVSGGSVTFSVAPTSAQQITLIRNVPNTQELDLVNQGAYFAEDVEQSFDLAAMRDQQMAEEISRAVKLPVSADASALDTLVANVIRLVGSADQIDAVAGIEADVTTVADISASVVVAAANSADITNFADVYLGPSATDPTVRADGSPLEEGDLYFSTSGNKLYVYEGAAWVAAASTVNGTARRQSFTATAAQTTFTITGGYDAGFIDVYLNGIKLVNGVDVTVSSGTSVVLASGALAGDSVDVVAYGSFSLADTLAKTANLSDLTDPSVALTNLGFSAFAKTLINDADAATARARLGAQASLGFTPVEQGGGVDMGVNKIRIGWRGDGTGLQLQVDASVIGVIPVRTEIIGINQTWQNVIGSRAVSTSYQNTTGRPIQVYIDANSTVSSGRPVEVSTDNATWVQVSQTNGSAGGFVASAFVVPNNHYYRVNGAASLKNWAELR